MSTSRLQWRRIAIAVVLGEALPILALVLIVLAYGLVVRDSTDASRDAFAQQAGWWVGPIAGAILTFALSYWVNRRSIPGIAVRQGTIIGAGIGLIDLTILAATGAGFQPLFLISNLGKLVAGVLGGVMAARRTAVHPG